MSEHEVQRVRRGFAIALLISIPIDVLIVLGVLWAIGVVR